MIRFNNLIHSLSTYSARYGGPRYRCIELAKYINKSLSGLQEEQLKKSEKINTILSSEAFLSSNHKPIYLKSLQHIGGENVYLIQDELGFMACFTEETEILLYKDGKFVYNRIDNIQVGDLRVLNLEVVPELRNNCVPKFSSFGSNFLKINTTESKKLMCDGINSLLVLKTEDYKSIESVDKLDDKNNIQEIYLLEITTVCSVGFQNGCFELEFLPFSYVLTKDANNSNSSENRYYNELNKTRPKRYLNNLRSKSFKITKEDKSKIEMELINEKDCY
jgi:hypothetical protein